MEAERLGSWKAGKLKGEVGRGKAECGRKGMEQRAERIE